MFRGLNVVAYWFFKQWVLVVLESYLLLIYRSLILLKRHILRLWLLWRYSLSPCSAVGKRLKFNSLQVSTFLSLHKLKLLRAFRMWECNFFATWIGNVVIIHWLYKCRFLACLIFVGHTHSVRRRRLVVLVMVTVAWTW
jgi:hypothetical protein